MLFISIFMIHFIFIGNDREKSLCHKPMDILIRMVSKSYDTIPFWKARERFNHPAFIVSNAAKVADFIDVIEAGYFFPYLNHGYIIRGI